MRESIRREVAAGALAFAVGALALGYLAKGALAHKHNPEFACDVTHIRDGDTWLCRDMIAPVRIWGVDAPDFRCAGRLNCRVDRKAARAAKLFVAGMILGKRIQCRGVDVDRYGRVVARCTLAGADIACALVKSGHAIDMPRYSGGYYRRCAP